MTINATAIVGMGALGLMYGDHIQKAKGYGSVSFLVDNERMSRYKDAAFSVNGEPVNFPLVEADTATTFDLVIEATKYLGLRSAMEVMEKAVGEHTVIVSVLNGISSEEILAEKYNPSNIIPCVALGMDAMRDGYSLNYCNEGSLRIGITSDAQSPALDALVQYFESIQLPHFVEPDIMHAMWGKFLLNVGINQTCMVHDTTYSGALTDPFAKQDLYDAMHEVIAVAAAENINLTEEDFNHYIEIVKKLNPEGYPSMRQDALAHRRSEVDMFAGTVLKLAAKHQIPVPVNEKYYKIICEREAEYF